MQGKNGDTDVGNGLVGTAGEEEDGMNGESSFVIYTPSCVKKIAGGKFYIIRGTWSDTVMS